MYSVAITVFLWKILLINNVDPNQTPYDVASDLGPHCDTFTGFQIRMGHIRDVVRPHKSCMPRGTFPCDIMWISLQL